MNDIYIWKQAGDGEYKTTKGELAILFRGLLPMQKPKALCKRIAIG